MEASKVVAHSTAEQEISSEVAALMKVMKRLQIEDIKYLLSRVIHEMDENEYHYNRIHTADISNHLTHISVTRLSKSSV